MDRSISAAVASSGKTLQYVSLGYRGEQLGLVVDTDDEKIKALLEGKTIKKIIVVPGKLVNVVI